MTDDDGVGYGRPPRHFRFKPGQSGNPKGRPKGHRNLKTELKEELAERIRVTEAGTERRISKQRAVVKAQVAKAIKGDPRAGRVVLDLMQRLLESGGPAADSGPGLSAEERAVIETALSRFSNQGPAVDATTAEANTVLDSEHPEKD